MDYIDEKVACLRLGGEPLEKNDFDNNKQADIWPNCWPEVEEFINEGVSPKQKIQFSDVQVAINFLKENGYITYKKPAVWGQKGNKKKWVLMRRG